MSIRSRWILPAALLIVLPLIGTRTLSAASVCVNPQGTHGCFTSINAAIAAAAPGDVIRIAGGRYAENVVVDKPVTLAGEDCDHTVLFPAVSAANPCPGNSLCGGTASNVILVQANDVTIHDVTIDGDNPHLTSGIVVDGADIDARNGIITNNDIGGFSNLTVHDVTVKNVFLRGIYAYFTSFNFHDNVVTNVQGDPASIAMFNYGGAGRFVRNKVRKANDAISSNHSAGVQFLNNEVKASLSGVHTDNAGDGGGASDVIRGNDIDGVAGAYGIFVFVPYLPVTVADNEISNVDVGLAAYGGPFPAGGVVTSTFSNNDVDGRKSAGSVGVLVTTDTLGYGQTTVSAILQKNVVTDFENGVMIQASAAPDAGVNLNATCNAILRSTQRDIVSGDLSPEAVALSAGYPGLPTPGGAALTDVAFSQNTLDGKHVGADNRGTTVLTATKNFWGCAQGPLNSHCDSTVGLVVFTPWLTKPAACVRAESKHDY